MVYSPPRPAELGLAPARLPRPEASRLLRLMLLMRRFEEKAAELYARGQIKGFLHLYVGQEAVAAGVIPLLEDQDYIASHYREHGHAIARGLDSGRLMAELLGKARGVSGGRGGSMHLIDASRRFMGGYAIVAGQLPLACGLALANKHEGNRGIALAIMGDGAANEGEFHESLNLARVWDLPVLFLCENNLYGMGTAAARVSAVTDVHRRAAAYDIEAAAVDGMDLLAVREAATDAIDCVRSGRGPFLLEARTYRFRGHSMSDPEFYRDKDEINAWRRHDPIAAFEAYASGEGLLDENDVANLTADVEDEIEEAVAFAQSSPEPALTSLTRSVYRGR